MPSKKSSRNNPNKGLRKVLLAQVVPTEWSYSETRKRKTPRREDLVKLKMINIHNFRNKECGEIGFCFQHNLCENKEGIDLTLTFLPKSAMKEQLEIWAIKEQKHYTITESNNGEFEVCGRIMYYCTLQLREKQNFYDMYAETLGLELNGFVIWFYDIKNRDMVFNYLNKKLNVK